MAEKDRKYTTEQIAEEFIKQGGNVSATARSLGLVRSTVQKALRKTDLNKKPIAGGALTGFSDTVKVALPSKGKVQRYICTSAQNNTFVHKEFWSALKTLAEYYDAQILVGTYSYNQNAYGPGAIKYKSQDGKLVGTYDKDPWFDPEIKPYLCDKSLELAHGLIWCGEMNILPTAVNPLAGLETYTHRKSAIFPHAKVAMRSIATMQGEGTKLNYTTGTVTLMNYIQKKEGIKAEHHHKYGALVVEVDSTGYWAVRQIGWSHDCDYLQDLDVVVRDGKVTTGNTIEAITWGDLHGTASEPWVVELSQEVLDTLKPKYQFLHDVLEGVSINRHFIKHGPCPHTTYWRWLRGLHRVDEELRKTVGIIEKYKRPWCQIIVPDSNHDGWWLRSWLERYDYRNDPPNAELFLKLQNWFYDQLRTGIMPKQVNLTQHAFDLFGLEDVKFLLPDESFMILNRRIECGQHGHLGPNGKRGNPEDLSKIGRRANIGHTHSCGIWNGLYVAGTSSKLVWDYNWGPSSWSHSHILTYPNGQRAILTMWENKWKVKETQK